MVSAKISFIGQRIYYNHYRPVIKIRSDMLNSCELIFKNRDSAHTGEEFESYILFLCEDMVAGYLYVGKKFSIYEGIQKVGKGEIISI